MHLPAELRQQLEAMLTAETLGWLIGIMAVWVVGQALGYGEVVDVGLGALAVLTLGPEAVRAATELGSFVVGVANAQSNDDLDTAGAHPATVVSVVGVDGLMALVAHRSGVIAKDAVGNLDAGGIPEFQPATSGGGFGTPPPGGELAPPDLLEMAGGETPYTSAGKRIHKAWSDQLRVDDVFEEVGRPIQSADGTGIEVPYRVDLQTGQPQPNQPTQVAIPDAVDFQGRRIVDLKPLGRALSRDRQEIIRFIMAFKQREGHLPDTIEIQRYDHLTGVIVQTETYTPADFLPQSLLNPSPLEGPTP